MRTTSVLLVALCVAATATPAAAAPAAATPAAAADPQPHPKLSGRVLSSTTGLPVAGVSIFVATTGGLQQTTETDAHGHYETELYGLGHYSLIFAYGSSRSSRSFDVDPHEDIHLDEVLDDRGETILVDGHYVPPVAPKFTKDPNILPRYSDRAALGDYWGKAWMLVDIDETGTVQRVKFLKHPGYDLDPIAVETALATKFEPARDSSGEAIRTTMILPIEWPSYWWLVHNVGVTDYYNPWWGRGLRCIGDGPLNLASASPAQRDCSKPDLTKAASEPWITRGAAQLARK
jgi:hypothetical protein